MKIDEAVRILKDGAISAGQKTRAENQLIKYYEKHRWHTPDEIPTDARYKKVIIVFKDDELGKFSYLLDRIETAYIIKRGNEDEIVKWKYFVEEDE